MAKLKLKGLLLKGVHTLLVRHLQKRLRLKERVLNVDLEIGGGGGGGSHPDRKIRRGGWSPKNVFARRAPGDNVLPDQFQTVAAVLASDWCQKRQVFWRQ